MNTINSQVELCQLSLLEAMDKLCGRVFILYSSLYNYQLATEISNFDKKGNAIKIEVEIDKNLSYKEWYLLNNNGKYYSEGSQDYKII